MSCIQAAYISKDGIEISEVLSGVPEALQPLYKEVRLPKRYMLCYNTPQTLLPHAIGAESESP